MWFFQVHSLINYLCGIRTEKRGFCSNNKAKVVIEGSNVFSPSTAVKWKWVLGTCNPPSSLPLSVFIRQKFSSFGTQNRNLKTNGTKWNKASVLMKIFCKRVVPFISINSHTSFYANRELPTDKAEMPDHNSSFDLLKAFSRNSFDNYQIETPDSKYSEEFNFIVMNFFVPCNQLSLNWSWNSVFRYRNFHLLCMPKLKEAINFQEIGKFHDKIQKQLN